MHWSINVRSIFHHLLLFRVWHLHKTNKDMNERYYDCNIFKGHDGKL